MSNMKRLTKEQRELLEDKEDLRMLEQMMKTPLKFRKFEDYLAEVKARGKKPAADTAHTGRCGLPKVGRGRKTR